MSIANLINSELVPIFDNIQANSINTGTIDANASVGTTLFVGSNPPTVNLQLGSFTGDHITVPPGIFTPDIERGGSIGAGTLNIGITPSTQNVQIGVNGGNPITCPSGIFTTDIERGGSLGGGALTIGTATSTSTVTVGNSSATVVLQAALLDFPTLGLIPLSITDSRPVVSNVVNYNGALSITNAARVSFYRFGNWVTVEVTNLAAPASALDSVNPVIISGALPVGYQPAGTHVFGTTMVRPTIDGSGAQCQILANGNITFGSQDTNHFTTGNIIQVLGISVSFYVSV